MGNAEESLTISENKAGSDQVEDINAGVMIPQPDQEPVLVTEQDNRAILRKTDKAVLSILVWVYFLQTLDKSVLGYASLFGLRQDTGLVGTQYSLVGSIAPIAQLCWLPFAPYVMVKVPHRILLPILVLGWGLAQACMAAAHNYSGLLAARFFLGLFEAAAYPLFSVITGQWYRRVEQPTRVAAWYSTVGIATMFGSAVSDGLGRIDSSALKSWQILFLATGLVTIVTSPIAWWRLDNNVETARFLSEHERTQAVERLRANNTGIGSREFQWSQVVEVFLDLKTYLWFSMALFLNAGAAVTNVFGPLILAGLNFDKYTTSLLNIPFGAVQFLVIVGGSFAAQRAKLKGVVLALLMLPVLVGLVVLYILPRTSANTAPNLVAYYLLAFLFGGNPLIVTWIVGNTAGTTKKTVVMVINNIGVSTGNIIGPLLFNASDAPTYGPGFRAVMGMFSALIIAILAQWLLLFTMNLRQQRRRVKNGKPANITDHSMMHHYTLQDETDITNSNAALHDLTDRKNDEFVYIY